MANPAYQPFSFLQSIVVIFCGVVSGCITALQPLLLAALAENDQLLISQIGEAATAESLGMAIAMTVAALRFKPESLRTKAVIALSVTLVANLATGAFSGMGIILLRAVSGMCSGVLLWILVGLISRSAVPGRTFAIYTLLQSTLSFLLALLLSQWLLQAYGAVAGYILIALLDLLLLLFIFWMPGSYRAMAKGHTSVPPRRGITGLFSVFFLLAGIISFWVYVIPLGEVVGHPLDILSRAVSLAIGFQILAGGFAILFAGRLGPFHVCFVGAIILILMILLFLTQSKPVFLFGCLGLYCFIWIAVPPFQMEFLVEIDPSLKSAMFIGTAQLFGVALGPLLAAQLLGFFSLPAISYGAIACMAISIVLLVAAMRMPLEVENLEESQAT